MLTLTVPPEVPLGASIDGILTADGEDAKAGNALEVRGLGQLFQFRIEDGKPRTFLFSVTPKRSGEIIFQAFSNGSHTASATARTLVPGPPPPPPPPPGPTPDEIAAAKRARKAEARAQQLAAEAADAEQKAKAAEANTAKLVEKEEKRKRREREKREEKKDEKIKKQKKKKKKAERKLEENWAKLTMRKVTWVHMVILTIGFLLISGCAASVLRAVTEPKLPASWGTDANGQ